MLDKQEIMQKLKIRFASRSDLDEAINSIADCIVELSDIRPRLKKDAAIRHLPLLTPNFTSGNPRNIDDIVTQSKPHTLAAYFKSLHAMLSQPEVKAVLKDSLNIKPRNSSTLFHFAASLHELYVSGMKIQTDDTHSRDALAPSFVVDLLKISNLLRNKEAYLAHLISIEAELSKIMKIHPKKVRSHFFFNWAKDNDFNQNTVAVLNEVIQDADRFFAMFKDKIAFKDKGDKADHGAWSHLIQFYIIIEENKKSPFLHNHPIDIYTYLSTPACRGTEPYFTWNFAKERKLSANFVNAWDVFFDRLDCYDARSPEFITRKILSMHDTPVLQAKTHKQYRKYTSQADLDPPSNDEDITLNKYPNKR